MSKLRNNIVVKQKEKKKYEYRWLFIQALVKRGRKLYAHKFMGEVLYNIKLFLNIDPESVFERVSSYCKPYVYWRIIRMGSKIIEVPLMLYPDKIKKA